MTRSYDEKEIANFTKDADQWWSIDGPFKPLHRLNPVRMGYIREKICTHFGLGQKSLNPFKDMSAIDVGCGGGLVCEPMARLGANVTGIDADPVAIEVAQNHTKLSNLDITYHNKASEEITDQYDIVLALEIIEHVTDPISFVQSCTKLCKPDGVIIFSTLNRNAKSFALGIVAAEYILRWVPKGTHSWKKFVKPSELARYSRASGLKTQDISGLVYNPLKDEFSISKSDIDVNYFLVCTK